MSWSDLLPSALIAAAAYAGWKCISYVLAAERRSGRRRLRYVWPSAMVAWCWAMLWATSFPSQVVWLGKGIDLLLILFFAVNFVGAIAGNAVLVLLVDAPEAVRGATASAVVWLLWYGLIRVWEWQRERAGARGPLKLE
jgi:hypothetical protein